MRYNIPIASDEAMPRPGLLSQDGIGLMDTREARQFDATTLKTELYADIEALRLKLRAFSGRVSAGNPRFAESEFDTHAAGCLDAMREDLCGLIDDADDRIAADGYEPGEHPLAPSINPEFWAAE